MEYFFYFDLTRIVLGSLYRSEEYSNNVNESVRMTSILEKLELGKTFANFGDFMFTKNPGISGVESFGGYQQIEFSVTKNRQLFNSLSKKRLFIVQYNEPHSEIMQTRSLEDGDEAGEDENEKIKLITLIVSSTL